MENGNMMLVSCSIKNFQDFIYFNIFLSSGKEVLKKKIHMPSYQA